MTELKSQLESKYFENNDPLIKCGSCKKQVPITNLCIYCGAPILFKINYKKSERS
jgi:rRNA maturation endonuclease Nob1